MRRLAGGVMILAALNATPAWASLSSCSASVTPISFGNYDPLSGLAVSSTGSVSVTCSLISGLSIAVLYTIALSTGTGTYTNRVMTASPYSMNYNIYLNSGRTQVWGDGSGTTGITGTGYLLGVGNVVTTFTAFGYIPASQITAGPGNYTDSIIVTVTY